MPNETQQTLFIFDFDHTLVNDNTDTRPFHYHAYDILQTHLRNPVLRKQVPWTDLVNTSLKLLHDRGISTSRILRTVSESPFPEPLKSLLRRISTAKNTSQAIISDANAHYIKACLSAHGLGVDDFNGGIHTNQSAVTDKCIVVTPYTDVFGPHGCAKCPKNMCKSWIMRRVLEDFSDANVVYVGDGGNDYCPAANLPPHGLVLARKGYQLERRLAEAPVNAKVHVWANAEELVRIVDEHVPILT